MGAQGTTSISFGAFPGGYDASVAVTGQAGIAGGSLVEAWIFPTATVEHSVDEHIMIHPFIKVIAGNVVAGVGFTIYATSNIDPSRDGAAFKGNTGTILGQLGTPPQNSLPVTSDGKEWPMYGNFTVAWVWN